MIPVARIINSAERLLWLRRKRAPEYEPADARYALGELLQEVGMRIPDMEKTLTLTTEAGVGEYVLPLVMTNDAGSDVATDLNRILRVSWPWNEPMQPIDPALIPELRRQIAAGEIDYSTSQPDWYAFTRQADADKKQTATLVIERAASVRAGTVTIAYYPLSWYLTVNPATDKIEWPVAQENILKAGLTWKLAEVYDRENAPAYYLEYERQIGMWEHHQYFMDISQYQSEIQRF